MEKVYALIECVEREIEGRRFPSIAEAQQTMFKCYMETLLGGEKEFKQSHYATMRFPECLPHLNYDEDVMCSEHTINERWAYINDGPNHDNYDWKILEL